MGVDNPDEVDQVEDPAFDDAVTLQDATPKDLILDLMLASVLGDERPPEDGSPEPCADITVSSGGAVVSGTVIRRGEWLRLLAAEVGTASAELGGILAGAFADLDSVVAQERAERRANGLALGARRFLNMKDVVVIAGGGPAVEAPLWRVCLDDVTGWTMGRYGHYTGRHAGEPKQPN